MVRVSKILFEKKINKMFDDGVLGKMGVDIKTHFPRTFLREIFFWCFETPIIYSNSYNKTPYIRTNVERQLANMIP